MPTQATPTLLSPQIGMKVGGKIIGKKISDRYQIRESNRVENH